MRQEWISIAREDWCSCSPFVGTLFGGAVNASRLSLSLSHSILKHIIVMHTACVCCVCCAPIWPGQLAEELWGDRERKRPTHIFLAQTLRPVTRIYACDDVWRYPSTAVQTVDAEDNWCLCRKYVSLPILHCYCCSRCLGMSETIIITIRGCEKCVNNASYTGAVQPGLAKGWRLIMFCIDGRILCSACLITVCRAPTVFHFRDIFPQSIAMIASDLHIQSMQHDARINTYIPRPKRIIFMTLFALAHIETPLILAPNTSAMCRVQCALCICRCCLIACARARLHHLGAAGATIKPRGKFVSYVLSLLHNARHRWTMWSLHPACKQMTAFALHITHSAQ